MLSINMDDVMQVVSNIQNYLIAFGVVLVLALLVMFAVRKMPKAKKKMIRAQSGLAILLALAIVVNLICTGPMSTMLDLVSGEGSISEETSAEATELVNEITQEGIVLAQNDDNILPVASGSKLNVFGWASTSPCYGGTGSGLFITPGFFSLTHCPHQASTVHHVKEPRTVTRENIQKFIRTRPAGMEIKCRITGKRRAKKIPPTSYFCINTSAFSTFAGGMKKNLPHFITIGLPSHLATP